MPDENIRTEFLLGKDSVEKLKNSTVAVIGVGGVGSYTVEALARSAVGTLILVDDDIICLSNLNRQLHATHKTIGKFKVEVMAERVKDINPNVNVEPLKLFLSPDTADEFFNNRKIDYIVDAVDTVTAKLSLVVEANKRNIPIISCMGAGNHLDPTKFEVADIYKTSVCPLAKVMRHELKRRGIKSLKVLYSTEPPLKPMMPNETENESVHEENTVGRSTQKRQTPGSVAWVPSAAGLIIAGEVIKDIIK